MLSRRALSLRALSHFKTSPYFLNAHQCRHSLSTSTQWATQSRKRQMGFGTLALTVALSSSAYLYLQQPINTLESEGDVDDLSQTRNRHQTPISSLIRTYIVYTLCSIPFIVEYSPSMLSTLTSVPGIKQVTEALVRGTFFSQFVGGETALETIPVLTQLRAENKGAILNYSAEVEESEVSGTAVAQGTKTPMHKQIVEEIIRSIDVAADFEDQKEVSLGTRSGRKTWVAFKLSALTPDAKTFIKFSKYLVHTRPPFTRPVHFPGVPRPSDFDILTNYLMDSPGAYTLTKDDILALKELKDDLFRICRRAKERGVTVTIDAEYSWYQPAIDAFQLALMREFNRLPEATFLLEKHFGLSFGGQKSQVQPLVYGTFQAYLRRAPEQLEHALLDARQGSYALGVKLVRGAYHHLETSAHAQLRNGKHSKEASSSSSSSLSISPDALPPVWQSKAETDACFDTCARMLVKCVAEDIAETKQHGYSMPIPRVGVLFGTHNAASCNLVLQELEKEGLATELSESEGDGGNNLILISEEAARCVTVGQLHGMCDALSDSLANRTRSEVPFVVKYLPYGELSRVMPYLGRRAVENKSVLGAGVAREERERARKEIMRRLRECLARA